MQPKFKVGDVIRPTGYRGFGQEERPFIVGTVYWNGNIWEEDKSKWCYLEAGVEEDWGGEDPEEGGAPYNSWWEGYVELVKKKRYMEENE